MKEEMEQIKQPLSEYIRVSNKKFLSDKKGR